ncbi:hypothetical protein Tco_1440127 [Tanacetum coccineum]
MTRSTVKRLTEPLDEPEREFQRLRRAALRSHKNNSLAIAGRNLFDDKAFSSNNLIYDDPVNIPTTQVKATEQAVKSDVTPEALDEEACLEEQILSLMHRIADRFTNHRPEINRLMILDDHPLIEYGRYALGCMTGADMKKAAYLKSVRDELQEKR